MLFFSNRLLSNRRAFQDTAKKKHRNHVSPCRVECPINHHTRFWIVRRKFLCRHDAHTVKPLQAGGLRQAAGRPTIKVCFTPR